MYHRFNESKYPSTNIQMDIFKQQMNLIKESPFDFYNPDDFEKNFDQPKKQKKILITIDDAFSSFYNEAWPYLKKNKIPFVLFVSTEPVGNEEFVSDIKTASSIFLKELGYIPSLFSYPFGEYSEYMRNFISKRFTFGFGQHSGVIDVNKEKFELPRFPINENYGEIKRFKSIINSFPLEYKKLQPIEKKLSFKDNPPKFSIEFFEDQKNLNNINCYSNEGDRWGKSKTNITNNILNIDFREAFKPRRGRINCSLNDNGKWRWLGVQFIIRPD